jgi:Ca2+-binding EF-hand superfamily protein
MDDNNTKTLDKDEFNKAMRDFRVDLKPFEVDSLFNEFDSDKSGEISYDEFIRGVRGAMNPFRKMLVQKAFTIMDKDKSGVIDINDIKGVYNAKFHPDVKSGKRTEEEILGEFLETFETHHSVMTGGYKN